MQTGFDQTGRHLHSCLQSQGQHLLTWTLDRGRAGTDLSLTGGRVWGLPSSSFTVVHTSETEMVLFTFQTWCRHTAVGKTLKTMLGAHTEKVKVIMKSSLIRRVIAQINDILTSSSDMSWSSISLSSDSLSGRSLSSCAVFSNSWHRISSLWRP